MLVVCEYRNGTKTRWEGYRDNLDGEKILDTFDILQVLELISASGDTFELVKGKG